MNKNSGWVIIALILVVLCCCLSLTAVGVGSALLLFRAPSSSPTPILRYETLPPVRVTLTPYPTLTDPNPDGASETLERLRNTIVPNRNLVDLARRLEGKRFIPQYSRQNLIAREIANNFGSPM